MKLKDVYICKIYIRMDVVERVVDPGGFQGLVRQGIAFLWMHRFVPSVRIVGGA
jgi:hypothetical protein